MINKKSTFAICLLNNSLKLLNLEQKCQSGSMPNETKNLTKNCHRRKKLQFLHFMRPDQKVNFGSWHVTT